MSITVDYYFNWPGILSELAAQFRTWVGCDLQPCEGDSENLYCRFLGMEFSLYEHDLENDGELNFEDYRFKAGIRTPIPDRDFRPLQLITMPSLVYALYRRLAISDGILVFDDGLLLARYEQRPTSSEEKGLYDVVSADFVRYPQHLTALMSRMPEGGLSAGWEAPTIAYLRERGHDVKTDGT
jgi:hypothetical protein